MSEADFQAVPEVEIDTGVFKYVLIRLYRDDGEDTREENIMLMSMTGLRKRWISSF